MKTNIFIVTVFTVLTFQSCTLPSAVEIKAKPSINVPASTNLSALFTDAIKNSFTGDDVKILECTHPDLGTQTFLIYFPLFEEELDNPISSNLGSNITIDVPILNDVLLHQGSFPDASSEPMKLSELDSFMSGFNFKSVRAKLFISGSDFVEKLKIILKDTDPGSPSILASPGDPNDISNKTSGIDLSLPDYPEADLPPYGEDMDLTGLLNKKTDLQFAYEIFIKGGKTVNTGETTDIKIKTELLIWFELDFVAGQDGAEIKFPAMFEAGKDMFGRSGGGDDSSALDMLRSIRLEIKLNNDLFQGGTMKITGLSDYPLDDKSLVLNISPQDMEYINKTNPFSPNMGIWFEQGKNLAIPRNLKATSLNFSAEVDYRIDL